MDYELEEDDLLTKIDGVIEDLTPKDNPDKLVTVLKNHNLQTSLLTLFEITFQHAIKTLRKNSFLKTFLFFNYLSHPKRVSPGIFKIIDVYFKTFTR